MLTNVSYSDTTLIRAEMNAYILKKKSKTVYILQTSL